jgi:hypothetical protein
VLPDLLVDDDGEGGGRRRSVGKEAGSARRGREVGDDARWGGRRAALGGKEGMWRSARDGTSGAWWGGRWAALGALFAFAIGGRHFWVSSSSTVHDPNGEIGLVFGSTLLEIV